MPIAPPPISRRPQRARVASVERSDEGASRVVLGKQRRQTLTDRQYQDHYQDWQGHAKRYVRIVGIARFAAGITADTCSRCELRVEERKGPNEWEESKDARLQGIFDVYRNAKQGANELIRSHAWHYQVAGECVQVMTDGSNGVDFAIFSVNAVDFDKPRKGQALVKLTPNGKPGDETAIIVDRDAIQRFWIPDEEYPALATSPMAASIDDLHRLWALARVVQSTLDSRIAMDGVWWSPSEAHDDLMPDGKTSKLDAAFADIAKRRFSDTTGEDVASIVPFPMHTPSAEGKIPPPTWIPVGQGLDGEMLAFMDAARMDFARGINLPGSLAAAGGPGDSNHWTEWLVGDKFFDQVIAPVMDRITHGDLTQTFLRAVLKTFRLDPEKYRVGYDPKPVIVRADQSDIALRLHMAGILNQEATLEACNFDESQVMDAEELQALLLILSRGATGQAADAADAAGALGLPIPGATPIGPAGPATVTKAPPAPPSLPSPRAAAVVAAPGPETANRVIRRVAAVRQRLGRRLMDGAEVALAETLRRAGVKVAVRARNRRATTAAVRAAAVKAAETGAPLRPYLAAVGVAEHELLDHAFDAYGTQAQRWMAQARREQRAILRDEGLDPDEYLSDDDEHSHEVAAVGFLGASLVALARGALLDGPFIPARGEVTGSVPAVLVTRAIGVAEGRYDVTLGESPDDAPTLTRTNETPLDRTLISDIAGDEAAVEYQWEWAFYGEPTTPFEPHEDLGVAGFTTTMPGGDLTEAVDPDLIVSGSFPEADYYSPGDHPGCSCEWVPVVSDGGAIVPFAE